MNPHVNQIICSRGQGKPGQLPRWNQTRFQNGNKRLITSRPGSSLHVWAFFLSSLTFNNLCNKLKTHQNSNCRRQQRSKCQEPRSHQCVSAPRCPMLSVIHVKNGKGQLVFTFQSLKKWRGRRGYSRRRGDKTAASGSPSSTSIHAGNRTRQNRRV